MSEQTIFRVSGQALRAVEAEIIDGYMPPYPGPETTPSVIVKVGNWQLRRSKGGVFAAPGSQPSPHTGLFWDVYGDDFGTVQAAAAALAAAPPVPAGEPFMTFTLPLASVEEDDDSSS